TLRKWVRRGLLTRHQDEQGQTRYLREQLDHIMAERRRRGPEADEEPEAQPGPEPPPGPAPPAQNMHEEAARAQGPADPHVAALLERALAATRQAEEKLSLARDEIAWLKARVESGEQERAELRRLILGAQIRTALPDAPGGVLPPGSTPPHDGETRRGLA